MEMKAPRGTKDILPAEAAEWQRLEDICRKALSSYCYREIRTPLFEQAELFERSIGQTTDIVQKEMYSFQDKKGRNLALRPEGTAPVVRAFLEHNLGEGEDVVKLFYLGPFFRYERPQAGRSRQFHQLGVEVLGEASPAIDAEVIQLALHLISETGAGPLLTKLNWVGCRICQEPYRVKVGDYFRSVSESICSKCRERAARNPMRVFDCKKEDCREVQKKAPGVLDYLCEACGEHREKVEGLLNSMGVEYQVDPHTVRGLDYYTRTTFEICCPELGAQDAVAAGGRYDELVKDLGGPRTPAVGFAMGMERLLLAGRGKAGLAAPKSALISLATVGDPIALGAVPLLTELRREGLQADMIYGKRSLKSQMRLAGRRKASFVIILGEDEAKKGKVLVKDMDSGEQEEVERGEAASFLKQKLGT